VAMFQVKVFWVVTPCSDMVGYQRFGGPRCIFQGEMTTWTSEKLLPYHKTTWRLNPEDGADPSPTSQGHHRLSAVPCCLF